MGYEAGNLELSIIGFSNSAVNSVNATAKSLGSLYRVIKKMESVNFSFAGEKLEALFTKIARATNSINTANITNLASAAKSLSSISRLSNLEKMDFDKIGAGFNKLSIAIQPFLDKVKEAEASLTALDGVLRRTNGKKIQGLLDGGKGGKLSAWAKIGVLAHAVRRLGRFMSGLVQAGSDYNETLNLWQVAMRNNLDVADQFVNKMQKAYGISTKTLMNAQAIFKNMIGSLGNITDATAYALSEALVQMSADFASLYNVTLESAFTKMQAMLAGQVRPIRSVGGLDITEQTLFAFYQQLGGTKTMRQLNRTEKQLLSILAVYQQMGASGALGDMSKTINEFANQSRMLTEYWAELKTWSGLLLKDLIDEWGLLIKINALLITATEIVKAIAKSRGVGEENYLTGLLETTDATNDAVDELQGKLLDFDKFRSLEGGESASPLAIDEKLLQALTGYSSKIDQAQNAAQKLAETWLSILGFTKGANGEFTIAEGKLDTISNIFETIGITIGIIVGYRLFPWLIKVATGATGAAAAMTLLNYAIIGGVIFAVLQAIDAFDRGDYWAGIFATTIGVVLVGAFVLLHKKILITIATKIGIWFKDMAKYALAACKNINLMNGLMLGLGVAILGMGLNEFISNFDKLSNKAKVWIPILAGLAGVITAVAAGLTFMSGNWVGAIGLGAAVTGIGLMVGTQLAVPNYEMGASDIDSGTVFRAGEFGKTEAVYTGSNGKTNVANVQQMRAAFYQALVDYGKTSNSDGRPIEVYLDGERVYQNTTAHAKRRGQVWSNA